MILFTQKRVRGDSLLMFLNLAFMRARICWALLFLVSFATFSHELNGNAIVKLLAFEASFAIMLLMYVVGNGGDAKPCTLRITVFDVAVALLAAMYLYRCVGNVDVLTLTPMMVWVAFYCFVRCSDIHRYIGWGAFLCPVVLVVHLAVCLLQMAGVVPNYHSYFRVGGSFGNPDMLSAYLSALLPACYLSGKHAKLRFVALLLVFGLFVLLQSRTAIVATVATLAVYCLRRWRVGKSVVLAVCLVAVAGFAILVAWHPASFLGRVYIWIVSLWMMAEKPFGWGIHAFSKHYMEQQAQFTISHPSIASALNYGYVDSPYNEFLWVGVTFGVVALVVYAAAVALMLRMLAANNSALFYPFLTFQILSLSYFPFAISPLMSLYVVLCGSAVNLYAHKISAFSLKRNAFRMLGAVAFTTVAVFCAAGCVCQKKWNEARRNAEEADSARSGYAAICQLLKDNGRFLASYAELEFNSGDKESAYKLLRRAERCYTGESFLLALANMQEDGGDINGAKKSLAIAANMTPLDAEATYCWVAFLLRNDFEKDARRIAVDFMNRAGGCMGGFSVREKYYIRQIERLAIGKCGF